MTTLTDRLDVDLMDGRFYAEDPHPAWAWMRSNEPVYHDRTNDLWGLTRYDDVRAASLDPATFSNAQGTRPKWYPMPMMIDCDPPVHTRRRKLVNAGFTPRRIAEMRERISKVCDEIIDDVCERGECDFVHDVAARLPLIMIADMLGIEAAHRSDLLRWSDDMMRSQGNPDPSGMEDAAKAFTEYNDYMRLVIESRRATGRSDDLIGILAHAEIDGDRLSDDDLIFETLLILIGGDETSRHVLSGGMLALQENPDQLAALRDDRSRLTRAVEEMLRWVSPIQDMTRTMTREVTVRDTVLPEGAQVLLLYPSANRDEAVFDRASAFDIDRSPNPHMAFGLGTHFCLGNQLARLEIAVMFERLLDRLPDLHLVEGSDHPKHPSNFVCGLERLEVRFTPTPPLTRPE